MKTIKEIKEIQQKEERLQKVFNILNNITKNYGTVGVSPFPVLSVSNEFELVKKINEKRDAIRMKIINLPKITLQEFLLTREVY